MKLSNRSALAALALAALPLSCSSARARPNADGNAAGPVRVFTDSDFINDVASAEGFVYVATERGLLKYPATGGTPTRLTTRDGLPGNRLIAVSASDDGSAIWVATAIVTMPICSPSTPIKRTCGDVISPLILTSLSDCAIAAYSR